MDAKTDHPQGHPAPAQEVGRRERHKIDISNRLSRAALDLFAERGVEGTRVGDITNAADVGKGTFFNYFDSKENLAVQLMERMQEFTAKALEEAREGRTHAREILRTLAVRRMEGPYGSLTFNRSLAQVLVEDAQCGETLTGYMGKSGEMMVEMFTIFQQRGEVRSDCPPELLVRLQQASGLGLWFQWCLRPTNSLADAYAENADRLWHVFAPPAGTTPAKADHHATARPKHRRHRR